MTRLIDNKEDKRLTATQVCYHLNISVITLNNWYGWYFSTDIEKPEDTPELPLYEQSGPRAPRYWRESDIPKLKAFQNWIPRGRGGVMGEYNSKYWGDRGKNIKR